MKIQHNTIHRLYRRATGLSGMLRIAMLCALIMLCRAGMSALPLDTYAQSSRLSTGKWVKISVTDDGVYTITNSQLAQWGFKDPHRVRIYGYGGRRIADRLNRANYVDDLPPVQSVVTSRGVAFYGIGPNSWVESSTGVMHCEQNIYTTRGYYFVTEDDSDVPAITDQGSSVGNNPATTYTHMMQHELDLSSPGEAGYLLVGESFKLQNNRKFAFDIPGYVTGTDIQMEATYVAKTATSSMVSYTINGKKLEQLSTDKISAVSQSTYIHGGYSTNTRSFNHVSGNKLELTISVSNIDKASTCWLDYIAINYTRSLNLAEKAYLAFGTSSSSVMVSVGNNARLHVWDVTNATAVTALRATADNGKLSWRNDYSGKRQYVVWAEDACPTPEYEGVVANQDIHAMEVPQMVIFTLPEYVSQAQRLARLHAQASVPIRATVLNVEHVYNEFGSGSADIGALRRCLKMFHDRGQSGDSMQLGYALLMGRATYDNRHLTSQFTGSAAHGTIPYWMGGTARSQLSDNEGFGTDDILAMLDDDSGTTPGIDDLSVAVGRMPVTSANEAKNAIDKLEDYMLRSVPGNWKNSFLFLADDGDNGIHAQQTEDMIACLNEIPDAQNYITKVYVDAYDLIGGVCQEGRNHMYRMLDEGIMWWNYCGHANNHSWTGEGMFTFKDINNLYLRKMPVLLAATCDFLRWDSGMLSGGEIMFHQRNGGAIAMISATRPVYITDNGLLTRAFGRAISKRTADGRLMRLGDIYRTAKNNILNDRGEHRTNPNRLRYVLMGDPAMPLAMPSNTVRLEAINGQSVNADNQVTLQALQQATLTGTVYRHDGQPATNFSGTLMVNIYDADRSVTTKGNREENIKLTFDQHGDKLYSGSATVTDGRFELKVAMPGEIADNFRPAFINMYAYSPDGSEAIGINRDFYIYGIDESVETDDTAPVIHSMVLNSDNFANGATVNTDPMLIAEISDNVGINLSSAAIGHQMVITLDGRKTYNDVSLYYKPSTDGTPSGSINYPLTNLDPGDHTLTLKVWDTSANSATQQINFTVKDGVKPTIVDVYTDTNPASTVANFYVRHDRPDANMSVTITVYNLLGHPLWQTTQTGLSTMFVTAPVTWDLCDSSGRRVPRGIYLYRASISTDGEHYETAARKLAVTAQ